MAPVDSAVVDADANGSPNDRSDNPLLPRIAAVFLVKFDNRKGYTLAWHKSIDTLDVDGVVEFKSLPSGLHNVKEDLVYFVHEKYAGVSAFHNREDVQAERNARMLAIGVLVPLESGRMGKSWLHVENLKGLCREQAERLNDYTLLEKYWKDHQLQPQPHQVNGSQRESVGKRIATKKSAGYQSSRSMSVGTIPPTLTHKLSANHPALALSQMLHIFGPLILPLYRAALLRKRILLVTEAPVELSCNIVYNISIFSSIPRITAESIPLESPSDLRLRPLFNVGIVDIPALSSWKSTHASDDDGAVADNPTSQAPGWVACTTDDVLCTKPELFDLLVRLPTADGLKATPRKYPKMTISNKELMKHHPKFGLRATQRDVKRYRSLAASMRTLPSSAPPETALAPINEGQDVDDETASVASSLSSGISHKSVVEPQSWSRIAYTSLVWWASAGDKRFGLSEATEGDEEEDLALLTPGLNRDGIYHDDDEDDKSEEGSTREVAMVSFFHRFTVLIFEILGAAVQRSCRSEDERYRDDDDDDDSVNDELRGQTQASQHPDVHSDSQTLLQSTVHGNNEDEEKTIVEITAEDMAHIGLDIWSEADRKFVEEMVSFWWGREAAVVGGRVDCCGIRIM